MRKGFTLVEVMVIVAIIAIMASVALPNLVSYYDQKRVEAAKVALDSVGTGLLRFRTAVTKYPGALNHLTDSITSSGAPGAINSRNSCIYPTGTTGYYTGSGNNTDQSRWRTQGPFFSKPITTGGYPFFIGTMNNTLVRVPATSAAGALQLIAPNVRIEDVEALEPLYETAATLTGSNAGSIRWSASVNGYVTLTLRLEGITGC